MKNIHIIILAAGKGARMQSPLPKVLHPLAGKPLLQHVLEAAQALSPTAIYIVYGHQGEKIRAHFADNLHWVYQAQQLGTAHAVMQALPYMDAEDKVLILSGDVPLISPQTLQALIEQTREAQLGLITAMTDNPFGLGRILRDEHNHIRGIREEKEASLTEKAIQEINAGIYFTSVKYLQTCMLNITSNNTQQEFYLTDIVKPDAAVTAIQAENFFEVCGVNDLEQLYSLECYYQASLAKKLRLSGVMVAQNVILEGNIEIGAGSRIGANCILKNVCIGANAEIKPNSIIEDSIIGDGCTIGPFARIRPGTQLAAEVNIGNFVEIKNAHIGTKSKIPHLSYVGDTDMGSQVNFGAGAIICNYDGAVKHRTVIEDNVFIGSDVQLIAPVKIETGATIGAGSTITKTAPASKLTLSRSKQQTIENWKRPSKKNPSP